VLRRRAKAVKRIPRDAQAVDVVGTRSRQRPCTRINPGGLYSLGSTQEPICIFISLVVVFDDNYIPYSKAQVVQVRMTVCSAGIAFEHVIDEF
jgi:hypothetical protein